MLVHQYVRTGQGRRVVWVVGLWEWGWGWGGFRWVEDSDEGMGL